MSNAMKTTLKNFIYIALLCAIFSVFTMFNRGQQATTFSLEDDRFTLHGPENFSVTIDMNRLKSMETRNNFNPGTCIAGGTEGAYSYGTWENEEFGQYQLCILTKLPTCVIMTEEDGSVTVFNFENTQTTEEFGRSFFEYLQENGYL